MLLEWVGEDHFVSYQDSKLNLYRLLENTDTNRRELQPLNSGDGNRGNDGWRGLPGVTCMAFNRGFVSQSQKQNALAVGTSVGRVSLVDVIGGIAPTTLTESKDNDDTIVCSQSQYTRRACTDIAWHPTNSSLLAASFDKMRSEYSGVVWDVNSRSGSGSSGGCLEITKCSMDEAASTLAWSTYESPSLMIGTTKGILKLHDLRTFNTYSTESLTLPASTRKIKGIRCNPFNSHVIATFVESDIEPVKIWDLRKIRAGKSKIEPVYSIQIVSSSSDIVDESNSNSTRERRSSSIPSATITDVQWCTHRPNLLSVASSASKHLQIYGVDDEKKVSSRSVYSVSVAPSDVSRTSKTSSSTPVSGFIQAFSWQSANTENLPTRAPRLLVGSDVGKRNIKQMLSISISLKIAFSHTVFVDLW